MSVIVTFFIICLVVLTKYKKCYIMKEAIRQKENKAMSRNDQKEEKKNSLIAIMT